MQNGVGIKVRKKERIEIVVHDIYKEERRNLSLLREGFFVGRDGFAHLHCSSVGFA